jgi:hypothetical protein
MLKTILNFIKNNYIFVIIIIFYIIFSFINVFKIEKIISISAIIILLYKFVERIIFFIDYKLMIKNTLISLKSNNILLILDTIYTILILFLVILFFFIKIDPLRFSLPIFIFLVYYSNYFIIDRYQIWYKDKVYLFRKYYLYNNINKIKKMNNKIIIELRNSKEYLPIYYKRKEIDNYFNTIKNNIISGGIVFE